MPRLRTRFLSARPCLALVLPLLTAACAAGGEGDVAVGPIITVTAEGATTATVATARADAGYVAWVGSGAEGYDVYLATVDRESGRVSDPVRVNDIPGDAAPHDQAPAQVALGPAGEVYVLWQNNTEVEGRRFPASDLRLAISTDGGRSFRPAVTVNDDAGLTPSSHTFHDLVVGPDGTVAVSWIDSRKGDEHAIRIAAGESSPYAAIGPEVRIARSFDQGRTFTPSLVVDEGACPCCRTSIALDSRGALFIAWRKIFPGEVRDIVVARAGPEETEFGPPVRVSQDGWVFPGCPHAGPSIQIDGHDRLHIGWYTGEESRQGLWYSSSQDEGRSFAEPTAILTDSWVPASHLVLAREGERIWAGWEDRTIEPAAVHLVPIAAIESQPPVEVGVGRMPAISAAESAILLAWTEGDKIQARWVEPSRSD